MKGIYLVVFLFVLSSVVHAEGFREKYFSCSNNCRGFLCLECPEDFEDSDAQFRIRELLSSDSRPGFVPTVLTVGPDDALYVAQVDGKILRVALADNRTVASIKYIDVLKGRLIMGITPDPNSTPERVTLYVAHTDGRFENATADSGAIAVLKGPSFDVKNIITGLPRSAFDHATNGLAFGPDGKLYIGQAGMTNAGSEGLGPAGMYEPRNETSLSSAILVADVHAPVFNGSVEVFATGLRNPVDVAFHHGKLYATENSGNAEWGPRPASESPPCFEGGGDITDAPDELNLVLQGSFYGHPNPSRGECRFGAGEPSLVSFSGITSLTGLLSYQKMLFGEFYDRLLAVNFMQDKLYVIDPEMPHVQEIILLPYSRPLDVAVDSYGYVYMTWAGGTLDHKGQGPARLVVIEPVWTKRASLLFMRAEHAATAAGGKVYVMGGFLPIDGGGVREAERYDPVTDSWESIAPIPVGVNHPKAVSVGNDVYLLGGLTKWRQTSTDKVYKYDEINNTWIEQKPLPRAVGAMGVAVVGKKIYSVGGNSNGVSINNAYVFDTVFNRWKELSPMPTPRDHLASVSVDGMIYAVGGRNYPDMNHHSIVNTDAFERYDPVKNVWEKLPPMPTPRSGVSAAAVGKNIYVFGGEGQNMLFGVVEVFNTEINKWSSAGTMAVARHGTQAVVIGDMIYLPGGGVHSGGHLSNYHDVFVPGLNESVVLEHLNTSAPVVHERMPVSKSDKAVLGSIISIVLALIITALLVFLAKLTKKRWIKK